jgi:hypothetical protein
LRASVSSTGASKRISARRVGRLLDCVQNGSCLRAQVTSTSGTIRWTERPTNAIEFTTLSAVADRGQISK